VGRHELGRLAARFDKLREGAKATVESPMGCASIGGAITSTRLVLTLLVVVVVVVVPVLYCDCARRLRVPTGVGGGAMASAAVAPWPLAGCCAARCGPGRLGWNPARSPGLRQRGLRRVGLWFRR
jgi:hypothetical protein